MTSMTEQSTVARPQGEETEVLIARLKQGRERYLRSLQGVTDLQMAWRSSAGKWTILECAEHVTVAEEQMLRMWEKLAAPGSTNRGKDQAIVTAIYDRTRKNMAPAPSHPKGRFATLAEAIDRFQAARERTLECAAATPLEELRAKFVPHPLAGELDGYQLLTLMALHPERHALQIEEIKGDPGFPGSAH